MARKKWRDLSPGTKKFIIGATVADTAAKGLAIADVVHRPASQIKGPKWAWVIALTLVNSAGLLPAAYFIRGRRTTTP